MLGLQQAPQGVSQASLRLPPAALGLSYATDDFVYEGRTASTVDFGFMGGELDDTFSRVGNYGSEVDIAPERLYQNEVVAAGNILHGHNMWNSSGYGYDDQSTRLSAPVFNNENQFSVTNAWTAPYANPALPNGWLAPAPHFTATPRASTALPPSYHIFAAGPPSQCFPAPPQTYQLVTACSPTQIYPAQAYYLAAAGSTYQIPPTTALQNSIPGHTMVTAEASNSVVVDTTTPVTAIGLSPTTLRQPALACKVPVNDPRLVFKLVSIHSDREEAIIEMRSGDNVYLQRYNYGGGKLKRVVYRCQSHKDCEHHYRVGMYESVNIDKIMWALEEKGEHCGAETNRVQSGIHPALKKSVDAMARGGAGPKTILKQLAQTYSLDPAMLRKFPKPSQLKSRKSYLLQELEKGWQLETFADLCEWCNPRLCETKDAFFGLTGFDSESDEKTFQSKSFHFQNIPIVLKSFTHTYSEDGMTKESYGIVLTSRRIFRNVRYAAEGQCRDGIFAAADGNIFDLAKGNEKMLAVIQEHQRDHLNSVMNALPDLCAAMTELRQISEHLLERIQTLLGQSKEIPTLTGSSRLYADIINTFHSLLKQHSKKLTLERLVSARTVVGCLRQLHSDLDTLLDQGILEHHSLLQQGDWQTQWEQDERNVYKNLVETLENDAEVIQRELSSTARQEDILKLLKYEAEEHRGYYSKKESVGYIQVSCLYRPQQCRCAVFYASRVIQNNSELVNYAKHE